MQPSKAAHEFRHDANSVFKAEGVPLIFGEILFDRFPDGRSLLGGAPFNVCGHLQRFGMFPRMLTRIGSDMPGEKISAILATEGFDLSGLQLDLERSTGEVIVSVCKNGEPSYDIPPDQAWDAIELRSFSDVSLLYSGTLALRRPGSVEAFLQWSNALSVPLFIDVNLRQSWWEADAVRQLAQQADCLKCNEEEFNILFGSTSPQEVVAENGLDFLALTRGGAGMQLLSQAEEYFVTPPDLPGVIVDTVGAGDSVSAVMIRGYLDQRDLQEIAMEAVDLAARMCRVSGGRLG